MLTYITGLPPTVLINLEEHFGHFHKQFECRCDLFLCQTSNGCPEHMALVTQAEHLTTPSAHTGRAAIWAVVCLLCVGVLMVSLMLIKCP